MCMEELMSKDIWPLGKKTKRGQLAYQMPRCVTNRESLGRGGLFGDSQVDRWTG